ncbi:MAG TPA: DNA-binding response regulator [Elusimicrobia bacterium]|nr:DNA-binding response regulator [Elusimicrobiota bacterium]
MTGSKRRKIKVFLIDDHPIVRDGVRSYLAHHAIAVVGEASDGKEALRRVRKLDPDVIVLDVNLPSIDGGELARRLRRLVPRAKILAFSIHSSEEYVMRMARCGAQGYVMKDQPTAVLLEAIKRVARGGLHYPSDMPDALLVSGGRSLPSPPDALTLSARELEVLTLLADGLSNKGVAARLGIGVRTAESHRENLSRKLGIGTAAGLTRYAIRHGLTSLQ